MLWAFYLLDCALRVLIGWAGELRSRGEQYTAFPDPQIHDHVAQDCTKLAALPNPPLPSPPLPSPPLPSTPLHSHNKEPDL